MLCDLRDWYLHIAKGFHISEWESFTGNSLVRFLSPSFWQSSGGWWHVWYLRHWVETWWLLFIRHSQQHAHHFRSPLGSCNLTLTQYNRGKKNTFDTIMIKFFFDSTVGVGLIQECHANFTFSITEKNHFCQCINDLLQWPVVVLRFEIFKCQKSLITSFLKAT